MHSTLSMPPCPKTEDKKLLTSSIQLHKNLLQNPAYTVAIPALLELQSGRNLAGNPEEKSIKLEVLGNREVSPNKQRPGSVSEVSSDFKMDSIPHTTLLNYHPITAFSVGGELRLCLPQVMNSVLKNYSLQQIELKINDLNIYISRCSNEQAKCLKLIKVLPERVPYCGLITKSNAERLVHELLEKENESNCHTEKDKKVSIASEISEKLFGFRVYHECFGKCKGTLYPTLFVEPEARCIECIECKYLFAPNKFVCHAHRGHESLGICHWGFDSANWRSYIQISKDQENSKELDGHLEQMKNKIFEISPESNVAKRKLDLENPEKMYITPAVSTQGATPKKKFPRVDCDSGFGSSPDSNSYRSPTTSPSALTSSAVSSSASSTTAAALRLSTSAANQNYSSHQSSVGSHLTSVIRANADLYSQILTSSQQHLNGGGLLMTPGLQLQKNQQNTIQVSSARPNPNQSPFTVIKSDKVAAALFSPHLAFPNLTSQQQQELQRQLISLECGGVSPGGALGLQLNQKPTIVPGSVAQTSLGHSVSTSAPSVIIPTSQTQQHLTPGIAPALTNVISGPPPSVTMATDLVSPELRMISQAMEVTIAKINAQCSPTVKIHLDQLVDLLKEQQKQYLKDFAMTHQENERLNLELKTKENEVADAKIALSKIRQELEHADVELHKEKAMRFRNQVDLAQVLRHQQVLESYNSAIQHQQKSPLCLSSNSAARYSEKSPTDLVCPKTETDWTSLSPTSENSVDSESGSQNSKCSDRAKNESSCSDSICLPMSVLPRKSPTAEQQKTPETNEKEVNRVSSEPSRYDSPSPTHSTGSSSQLVIVDC